MDFGGRPFVPFLVFPGTCPQSAFHIYHLTFLQVLSGGFGRLPKEDTPVPLGMILEVTVGVFAALVGGDVKVRYRRP